MLQIVSRSCSVLKCFSNQGDLHMFLAHVTINGNSLCCYTTESSMSSAKALASQWQHTATHCNTLQHTATHCITLHHAAPHCTTLQHITSHWNTLRWPAWKGATELDRIKHVKRRPMHLDACLAVKHKATDAWNMRFAALFCNHVCDLRFAVLECLPKRD